MSCAHAYLPTDGHEGRFTIDTSDITFGRGALDELGPQAAALGITRLALFTDRTVGRLEPVDRARRSLRSAGIDVTVFDEVSIEPTDQTFTDAARFARDGRFDGYASVGGGSVIDTCKAASLLATAPAPLRAYLNAPVGEGRVIPTALAPHLACPTTSGTGAELTGIAVCDLREAHVKTAIASRRLRPARAIIDPDVTRSLPGSVVAASGFDVLCHAIESFTARPFTARVKPASPSLRPMSQGRNPWSDLGSAEALRLCARFLVRAVRDAHDDEAREGMMWAATLAGVAFGNAGVHLPHAMAYAIAGRNRDFHMPDYPTDHPLVPHGVSVVVGAPSALRFTAAAHPERHRAVAEHLGADVREVPDESLGDALAGALVTMMRDAGVPVGLSALGYGAHDLDALIDGTLLQTRLLDNAPRPLGRAELAHVFQGALS